VMVNLVRPGTSLGGVTIRNSNPAVSAVPNWGLQSYGAGPASACATASTPPNPGQSISGTITATTDTTTQLPVSVSFDLSVTYQTSGGILKTEAMNATDLSTSASCGSPLPFP